MALRTQVSEQNFNRRFNIEVGLEEGRRRFVNRVYNSIMMDINLICGSHYQEDVEKDVCTILGIRYDSNTPLSLLIGDDFFRNLHAIEALHRCLGRETLALDEIVPSILKEAEVDLEVR